MKPVEQRAELARIAGDQWGLITTAQASAAQIPRMLLTRMTASGELERVVHGVYATPAAAADDLVEIRARWLALDPAAPAEQRLRRQRHRAGVLSHATAASLHEVGDLLDDIVEVTLPARHQSRREGLRVHVAELEPEDVTIVDGLPVTTAARTVADLVAAGHDRDHVATVLGEAIRRGLTDRGGAQRALERRLGARARAVLEELLTAAGLDEASVVRQVVGSPLGQALISSSALEAFNRLVAAQHAETFKALAPVMPKVDLGMSESIRKTVADLAPKVDLGVSDSLLRTIASFAPMVDLGMNDSIRKMVAEVAGWPATAAVRSITRAPSADLPVARRSAAVSSPASPDDVSEHATDDDSQEPTSS